MDRMQDTTEVHTNSSPRRDERVGQSLFDRQSVCPEPVVYTGSFIFRVCAYLP